MVPSYALLCLLLLTIRATEAAKKDGCTCIDNSNVSPRKQLIVTYLPIGERYYRHILPDIADFFKKFAEKSHGLDDFLILYPDRYRRRRIYHEVGSLGRHARCLETPGHLDVWTRDLGLVLPKKQVRFVYDPNYLVDKKELRLINRSLGRLLRYYHVLPKTSAIKLDGGNVVDNNQDKAFISERVVKDNRRDGESFASARLRIHAALEKELGVNVALLADNNGTTGHADGMVSVIDKDVVLATHFKDYPEVFEDVKSTIQAKFPALKVYPLPSYFVNTTWRDFDSAEGIYVNSLVTDRAVYVPQFQAAAEDAEALKVIKRYLKTGKKVVPIDVSNLSFMGGSVRCMTWQIDAAHPIAKELWNDSFRCK